jgi:predicted Rossmann-fold nucleotide-binding protein
LNCCGIHVFTGFATVALGFAIAKSGMGFVYGGGKKGIMGIVSDAALDAGAQVTGKWFIHRCFS